MKRDMAERVAGHINDAGGDLTKGDAVTCGDRALDAGNFVCFVFGAYDGCACGVFDGKIATGMIGVPVRVPYLGDGPAFCCRLGKVFFGVGRVYGGGLAAGWIVDQIAIIIRQARKLMYLEHCRKPRVLMGFKLAQSSTGISMRQDVIALQNFYASPLGKAAADTLAGRIGALWGGALAREQVLGLGFATPLLERMGEQAEIRVAGMPAAQGGLSWAATGRSVSTVLVDEGALPFRDGTFSRIIMLHGLEEAYAPAALLREIWRVLAPEGKLIVIVANRLGLWARAEATPFGHGRPWTRSQLTKLLHDTMFQTTAWTHGLHMPPSKWGPVLALHEGWEKVGETVSRVMGGAVLVEASKRLYADTGGGKIAFSPIKAVRAGKGIARAAEDEGEAGV